MSELKTLLLGNPPLTVAAAESLTCGRVQSLLGEVSGSSKYFRGGITVYTLEQKVTHLGVEREKAEPVNCVSAEVAEQMARGVRRLFKTHLGLATTGYAEPSPEWRVETPFAWWALAYGSDESDEKLIVRSGRVSFPQDDRVTVQRRVADAVVAELVRFLREIRAG